MDMTSLLAAPGRIIKRGDCLDGSLFKGGKHLYTLPSNRTGRKDRTMADSTTTAGQRSRAGFDVTPPSSEQLHALVANLDDEERRVLLEHGTERPFCGIFNEAKDKGTYCCRLCGLPLFHAGTKFESGTGWPSFFDPIDRDHVAFVRDSSYGMVRTEIRCARCEGHLGHVFDDGPPPTGERYCMNSVSLRFVAEGDPLPDELGRGAPEGEVVG